MQDQDPILTGQVEGIAFGGNGVIRHEGLVVFIPYTVEGDVITYKIVQKKKSHAFGQLIEVLQPSQYRTIPHCPYYGTCGGCQMQHIQYDMQLESKKICVQDILRRIGKLTIPAIDINRSPEEYAYRRHITLTLAPQNGAYTAGYFTTDNVNILKVDCCPIFVEPQDAIIQHIQQVASQLKSTPDNPGKVMILKHVMDKYILHFQFQTMPSNVKEVLGKLPFSNWEGLIVSSTKDEYSIGVTEFEWQIDAFMFKLSPKAFIQNHPEQSSNIYRHIIKRAYHGKPKRVLDLYCGIGISSIFLANQGAEVIGVESNDVAIKLAKENAVSNKMERASFICAPVEKVIKRLLNEHQPDMVLVNPPRTGLSEKVLEALVKANPKNITYISCMPPTLARDLALLCRENHYDIDTCSAFDMFPQTMHVEVVASLQRKSV